jgi:anti-sigma B factor antagonist
MHAPRPLDTERPESRPESSSLLVAIDGSDEALVQRIAVAGDLDAISATELQKTVIDVLRRERPRRIELDLRGVVFLDSAGVHALVSCHGDAQQVDCRLTVIDPHPMAYRILQITGLLDHFGVTGTRTTRED